MIVYLIRHSGPFVSFKNEKELTWDELNTNMVLSIDGEKNARKLCKIKDFKKIKNIYASACARAVATAKYIASVSNAEIVIDRRLNERSFGIKYLKELPNNYILNQFKDKNLKLEKGESLNEVGIRFDDFLDEILKRNEDCALCINGIVLINYLSKISNLTFDGEIVKVIFNDQIVINRKLNSPDIFKVTFKNKKVVSLQNIKI